MCKILTRALVESRLIRVWNGMGFFYALLYAADESFLQTGYFLFLFIFLLLMSSRSSKYDEKKVYKKTEGDEKADPGGLPSGAEMLDKLKDTHSPIKAKSSSYM